MFKKILSASFGIALKIMNLLNHFSPFNVSLVARLLGLPSVDSSKFNQLTVNYDKELFIGPEDSPNWHHFNLGSLFQIKI